MESSQITVEKQLYLYQVNGRPRYLTCSIAYDSGYLVVYGTQTVRHPVLTRVTKVPTYEPRHIRYLVTWASQCSMLPEKINAVTGI